MRTVWIGLLAWLVLAGIAAAHEVRPIFLDVHETMAGHYEVTWKRPVFNGQPLAVVPRFAAGCTTKAGTPPQANGVFAVQRLALNCAEGLSGTIIAFDGLSGTMVDGLVRVTYISGQRATGLVHPDQPSFKVPAASTRLDVFATYLRVGVEHILGGFDHLLFVLALVLFVKRWRRLLVTATAFTLAHSLTLSLASLGVIHAPIPPVEALIALSILFMALELLRARADPDRAKGLRPASLAFVFGLLHGLGFASALAEIGLPQREIPLALFSFNVGVEAGQVGFIVALLALGWLARWLSARRRDQGYLAATYLVGSLAAFWTVERIASF